MASPKNQLRHEEIGNLFVIFILIILIFLETCNHQLKSKCQHFNAFHNVVILHAAVTGSISHWIPPLPCSGERAGAGCASPVCAWNQASPFWQTGHSYAQFVSLTLHRASSRELQKRCSVNLRLWCPGYINSANTTLSHRKPASFLATLPIPSGDQEFPWFDVHFPRHIFQPCHSAVSEDSETWYRLIQISRQCFRYGHWVIGTLKQHNDEAIERRKKQQCLLKTSGFVNDLLPFFGAQLALRSQINSQHTGMAKQMGGLGWGCRNLPEQS